MQDISRRTFIELLTGTIISLPVLAGGAIVAPREAHAEEATVEGEDGHTHTIIDVVRAWEVAFQVVDVSKPRKTASGYVEYEPISGAHVKVTSRYNGKVVEGDTGANGFVNLDVRELSENLGKLDVGNLMQYEFNGTVEISREGYRLFKTALVRVEGGTGLQVPTQPNDASGVPWPYLVSFDEWDVLYYTNEFLLSQANKGDHTFAIELHGLPNEAATVLVELWYDSPIEFLEVEASVSEGKAVVRFKDSFLHAGDPAALVVGGKLKLSATVGDKTYRWPLSMRVAKAIIDDKPIEKKDQSLSPFNTSGKDRSGSEFKWPKEIPVIGGGTLSAWMPSFPVNFYLNPFGYFQVSAKTPDWGYKDDHGLSDDNGWGKYPRKSVEKQLNKKIDLANKMAKKFSAANAKEGTFKKINDFNCLSFMFSARAELGAQWKSDKGLFEGMLGASGLIAFDWQRRWNFFAGPVPVLIGLQLKMDLELRLSIGCYNKAEKGESLLDAALSISRWNWDYANTGLSLTITIAPSLSVGVGLDGVASISVKGTLTIAFNLACAFVETPGKNPHFLVTLDLGAVVVLDLFFFTETFEIGKIPTQTIYDNWKSSNGIYTPAFGFGGLTLDQMLSQMHIVTQGMFVATMEARYTGNGLGLGERASEMELTVVSESCDDGNVVNYSSFTSIYQFDDNGPIITSQGEKPDGANPDGENARVVPADVQDEASMGAAEVVAESVASSDAQAAEGALEAYAEGGELAESAAIAAGIVAENEDSAVGEEPVASDDSAEVATEEPAGSTPEAQAEQVEVEWLSSQLGDLPYLWDANGADVIECLGEQGGVRPRTDVKLFENIVGDPKAKVVYIDEGTVYAQGSTVSGGAFMLRLASVDVGGGKMRSRLVAIGIDGALRGMSKVLEFVGPRGMKREDLFDYDFVVDSRVAFSNEQMERFSRVRNFINVVAISGTREGGDSTQLYSAATNLCISHLAIDLAQLFADPKKGMLQCQSSSWTIRETLWPGDKTRSWAHCLANLQLARQVDAKTLEADPEVEAGYGYFCMQRTVVTYIDRRAETPEQTFGGQATTCMGVLIFTHAFERDAREPHVHVEFAYNFADPRDLNKTIGELGDKIIYEQELYYSGDDDFTIMLRGDQKAHYLRMQLREKPNRTIKSLKRCQDLNPAVRLVSWPNHHDYPFLACYPKDTGQLEVAADSENRDDSSWTLHKARWNGDVLEFVPVGHNTLSVSSFAVSPNGSYILWPQSREPQQAGDCVWTADGEQDAQPTPAAYHIMSSRVRGDCFSAPFIVADLAHDTDALVMLGSGRGASVELLRTEYIAPTEQPAQVSEPLYYASNIWYTSVPDVVCATAIGCGTDNPFANPGKPLTFYVSVRNDGNVFLSGCTLTLCEYDDGRGAMPVEGASVAITFNKDTLQESAYNPKGEDGRLQDIEDDYALAPGKKSVYAVTVRIPESWAGEKKVTFAASDAKRADTYRDGELVAEAADDVAHVEFYAEPGTVNLAGLRTSPDSPSEQYFMNTLTLQSMMDETLASAPVTENSAPTSANAGGGTVGGRTQARTQSRKLPDTGDFAPSGPLATGLAVAGAAVLAYERRRAENERE